MNTALPSIDAIRRQMDQPVSFRGVLHPLSNMWLLRTPVFGYRSSEHAFVAAKTTDPAVRNTIRLLATGYDAKRYGKSVLLRPDWQERHLEFMEVILWEKFTVNLDLGALLLATLDVPIVERNTWGDRYWGCHRGTGANHLGRLLTRVRIRLSDSPLVLATYRQRHECALAA